MAANVITVVPPQANVRWGHTVVLIASLVGIVVFATDLLKLPRIYDWLGVVAMFVTFLIVIGYALTGRVVGVFIDGRNRLSLSRLQLTLWTVLVVSAFIAAGIWNLAHGVGGLDIKIPEELWALMGISTTSLVASHLILSSDPAKPATKAGSDANTSSKEAAWRDLVEGEAQANANYVDISRVQMLFFTLTIFVAYGYALVAMFTAVDPATKVAAAITDFPALSQGMIALIGISHAGYLTRKAV
jgi:hypothetical protein